MCNIIENPTSEKNRKHTCNDTHIIPRVHAYNRVSTTYCPVGIKCSLGIGGPFFMNLIRSNDKTP